MLGVGVHVEHREALYDATGPFKKSIFSMQRHVRSLSGKCDRQIRPSNHPLNTTKF